jgi:hypothetical protein
MSGHEAISNESFGVNCRNIVQWVSLLIVQGLVAWNFNHVSLGTSSLMIITGTTNSNHLN